MNFDTLTVILAQTPGAAPNPTGQLITMGGYMAILIAIFYMVGIRPQQKRAKELNALLATIKPGDKVVTSSGIIGTVVSVKDKSIALRSAETKLEILKSAVAEVTERSSGGDSET